MGSTLASGPVGSYGKPVPRRLPGAEARRKDSMRAMILAAGKGERLRPLTDTMPKPLVPVGGRPLIEYTLALLRRHGIREVVVNLYYLGALIEAHLGDGSKWGMEIVYSRETTLLGTGGGIKNAAPFLQGGPFVVINADILVGVDLDEVVRFHHHCKALATMVLREDEDVDSYGAIGIDEQGRVRQFLGSPSWGGPALRRLMFTGVHIMDPRIFDYMLAEEAPFSITEKTYPALLRAGEPVFGYQMTGFWIDVGSLARYEAFTERLARGEIDLRRSLGYQP